MQVQLENDGISKRVSFDSASIIQDKGEGRMQNVDESECCGTSDSAHSPQKANLSTVSTSFSTDANISERQAAVIDSLPSIEKTHRSQSLHQIRTNSFNSRPYDRNSEPIRNDGQSHCIVPEPCVNVDVSHTHDTSNTGRISERRSLTYASQLSMTNVSLRDLANTALVNRQTTIGDVTFDHPEDDYVRENIRRIQAYSRRDAPIELEMRANMLLKNKRYEVRMDRDHITYYKRSKQVNKILTDDIIGAQILREPGYFRIHYFTRGKGKGERALRRKHRQIDFTCPPKVATHWVNIIQELVRWQARAPPIEEKRRLKIVINPHSGKRKAQSIWIDKVKMFFDLANYECKVQQTERSGHAIEMGKQYDPNDGFEALLFIGGDGTLCEFMNGLLSRPEIEWREIVASTPISLISAGTENAFVEGVGIPTLEAAIYCIIKRKMRPLDVITVASSLSPQAIQYSYCGLGWGIAADIAAESERYRYLGTSRYNFLKLKRTIFKPVKHTGRVRYVLSDPQPKLRAYHDIRNEGALDQFEVEQGNVYDYHSINDIRKSYVGESSAIHDPASHERYPPSMWTEESGHFFVVGVIKTAPGGRFAHPSDGHMDLIMCRKGNLLEMMYLSALYAVGKEIQSPLFKYLKVKAVEIYSDQSGDALNLDGEVLPGPNPWRMEIVPSLFKALSEK